MANGNKIYTEIAQKLGEDHPILTRAVLVKRVLDVAETVDYADFSKKIGEQHTIIFQILWMPSLREK